MYKHFYILLAALSIEIWTRYLEEIFPTFHTYEKYWLIVPRVVQTKTRIL